MPGPLPFEIFAEFDSSVSSRSRAKQYPERIEAIFDRMKEHKVKFPAEPGNDMFRVNVSEVARWCGMSNTNPFYKNDIHKKKLLKAIKELGIEGETSTKSKTEELLESDLEERGRDVSSLKRQVQSLVKEKASLEKQVKELKAELKIAQQGKAQAEHKASDVIDTARQQRNNLLETGGRGYEWLN